MKRVCLVGAGNVSHFHAEALDAVDAAELVAVCDTDEDRARQLADQAGIDVIFTSLEAAIASRSFDAAHVLVPPDLHVSVARSLLEGGLDVFVEKPMGTAVSDCEQLAALAAERGTNVGVNHNALCFPAYSKLREAVRSHELGRVQHVVVIRNLPRSMEPPGGHWMLARPKNLIFESGVHPLSQIHDLAGPLVSADVATSGRREHEPGRHWFDTWQVSLVCAHATGQLFLAYGGAYRAWQVIALCEDGMLLADIERDRFTALDKTGLPARYEGIHLAMRVAPSEVRSGVAGVARTWLSAARLIAPADPYAVSMRNSVAAFYGGHRGLDLSPKAGAEVVAFCERIADQIPADVAPEQQRIRKSTTGTCDATVLGGTGFIGRSLVERMVEAGMTVRVMARSIMGLPELFDHERIQLVAGNVTDSAAIDRVIAGARCVVHLAHGGSFTWDDVDATVVRPAEQVADSCLRHDIERLVYAGSIASLYLGDPDAVITGTTPNDPRVREQGPYAFGKARSEEALVRRMHGDCLPLSILRPAIVVGAGGNPLHPAFGRWRGDLHCVGWNQGTNPLPLVLASDVAAAIMLAVSSDAAVGATYNLVGDVRLSARRYVAELGAALERPFAFHPRSPAVLQGIEVWKWLAKRLLGRRDGFPSYRAIESMGFRSTFDCSDVQRDLGWSTVPSYEEFIERAVRVHARPTAR